MLAKEIIKKFNSRFAQYPIVVRSPTRINLIGEHTDYNDGFVLPAAIDKAIFVAIQKREDENIILHSEEFNETVEFTPHSSLIISHSKHWSNYILGVVFQLKNQGYKITGFNLLVAGNIPVGAGLSSSAALECATVFALNELFNLWISKIEMVKIAQQTEHEFVGVKCGIMDQFSNMFGKKNNLILLDCRSLEHKYIPVKLEENKIVLFDTQVKHSLANSEYNLRREQCEEGVLILKNSYPKIKNLRDVTIEMLAKIPTDTQHSALIFNRCKYIIEENERLIAGTNNLLKGDILNFGKKMFITHFGLSNLYEVSCVELDFLVDFVKNENAVYGARMHGGGFGGCTINIINESVLDDLSDRIKQSYYDKFNRELKIYDVSLEDGTSVVVQ